MLQLLSGIKPEPFSIGSKTVITDESVTRDEADQDESVQQELNLDLFSQRIRTLKTMASSIFIGILIFWRTVDPYPVLFTKASYWMDSPDVKLHREIFKFTTVFLEAIILCCCYIFQSRLLAWRFLGSYSTHYWPAWRSSAVACTTSLWRSHPSCPWPTTRPFVVRSLTLCSRSWYELDLLIGLLPSLALVQLIGTIKTFGEKLTSIKEGGTAGLGSYAPAGHDTCSGSRKSRSIPKLWHNLHYCKPNRQLSFFQTGIEIQRLFRSQGFDPCNWWISFLESPLIIRSHAARCAKKTLGKFSFSLWDQVNLCS